MFLTFIVEIVLDTVMKMVLIVRISLGVSEYCRYRYVPDDNTFKFPFAQECFK
jgi:hypothetical protein